jgi:hypothetical protein
MSGGQVQSAQQQFNPTPTFPSFVPLQQPKADSFFVDVASTSTTNVSYQNPQCVPQNFQNLYRPPVSLRYY